MLFDTIKISEYALDTPVNGKVPVNLLRELYRRAHMTAN